MDQINPPYIIQTGSSASASGAPSNPVRPVNSITASYMFCAIELVEARINTSKTLIQELTVFKVLIEKTPISTQGLFKYAFLNITELRVALIS